MNNIILFPSGRVNSKSSMSLEHELSNFDPFFHASMYGDPVYDYQGWPMAVYYS